DADEQEDGVAADEHAHDAQPDEERGDDVGTGEVDHAPGPPLDFVPSGRPRDTARAAMRAASSSTDKASKGHTHVPKISVATAALATSRRSTASPASGSR